MAKGLRLGVRSLEFWRTVAGAGAQTEVHDAMWVREVGGAGGGGAQQRSLPRPERGRQEQATRNKDGHCPQDGAGIPERRVWRSSAPEQGGRVYPEGQRARLLPLTNCPEPPPSHGGPASAPRRHGASARPSSACAAGAHRMDCADRTLPLQPTQARGDAAVRAWAEYGNDEETQGAFLL